MKIIGFNLSKISIERKEKPEGKIELKQNINVDAIEKEKISITKDEALKIEFTFTINYEPNFANVEFKGQVVALPDKDEMKKVLKEWKDKKLPEGTKTGIFNFIMSKCNIKALTLEDEMGLPTHVPMPRLSSKKQE